MGRTRGTKREPRQRLLGRTLADIERLAATWNERAAIMEFDGGLPRTEAEWLAWVDLLDVSPSRREGTNKGATPHWELPEPNSRTVAIWIVRRQCQAQPQPR